MQSSCTFTDEIPHRIYCSAAGTTIATIGDEIVAMVD